MALPLALLSWTPASHGKWYFFPHIRQVSHLQEMVVYLPLVRLHICKKWFLLFIGWMSSLQEMVLPLIRHASSLVEVFFPFQF